MYGSKLSSFHEVAKLVESLLVDWLGPLDVTPVEEPAHPLSSAIPIALSSKAAPYTANPDRRVADAIKVSGRVCFMLAFCRLR